MRLPPKITPAQIAEAQRMAREWKRLGASGKSRSECALDERAAPKEGSFARPTEPAGAPYEVGRCAGPACPERLTAKSFARWANEPSSRSKPSVRPAASAPISATSGRIEATLARFVRRGRDRRLPQHRMGLIGAGACPTHRRSVKAKGLAVASHRAAATWLCWAGRLSLAVKACNPQRVLADGSTGPSGDSII
jgi:hypothetical protein